MMTRVDIEFPIGKDMYIVAVSGGVDSVVLLDLLSRKTAARLIVAHFDHGIRPNSKDDRLFVEALADKYKLPFVYKEGHLGPSVSEEAARKARYKFLNNVRKQFSAKAITTAHHQDDVLETAVINLMRGTGRLGLSSLQSHQDLRRPLLNFSKKTLTEYAKDQGLNWREDETNNDTSYLRNYIRHQIIPKFSSSDRAKLLDLISKSTKFNAVLDQELSKQLEHNLISKELDRQWFIDLPHAVAKEVIATWLRKQGMAAFDRQTIERLVVASKTFRANKQVDIYNGYSLIVKQRHLALTTIDR